MLLVQQNPRPDRQLDRQSSTTGRYEKGDTGEVRIISMNFSA